MRIIARVDDNESATTIKDDVTVTINEQPLSVVLGTGDELRSVGATFYELPYSVLVTDSLGNPVAGATVELSINPAPTSWAYKEGRQVQVDTDGDGKADVWAIPPNAVTCRREDVNQNGRINGGEDRDGDGALEPGGVASVPASVTTDSSGVATFSIRYPQSHAGWVRVRLSANTAVEGSQGSASSTFILPLLAKDQQDVATAPPGLVSPYGDNGNCAVPDS